MEDSEKKEKPVISEPSLEKTGGKLSEVHGELKHPKKKKEEKELEELKKKLEQKEKGAKEYYDRLLRKAAYLENFKKSFGAERRLADIRFVDIETYRNTLRDKSRYRPQ